MPAVAGTPAIQRSTAGENRERHARRMRRLVLRIVSRASSSSSSSSTRARTNRRTRTSSTRTAASTSDNDDANASMQMLLNALDGIDVGFTEDQVERFLSTNVQRWEEDHASWPAPFDTDILYFLGKAVEAIKADWWAGSDAISQGRPTPRPVHTIAFFSMIVGHDYTDRAPSWHGA